MHPYQVLVRPIISEKSTMLLPLHQYSFEVSKEANKMQIREAVELAFKVNVLNVNVIHVPGKMRRMGRHRGYTSSWKKAVVTIRPDQRIEIFEGT
jgi:large subunit ribosomal protein L23